MDRTPMENMPLARYFLHGQKADSVMDGETGIIVACDSRESAELLRDQLNGYEERLDATRAKLAECEQKAESYDLTHTGDWFERAHALGQRDPAKYAGRDIWHVAVEMAESLAEVERERHREHEARVQMEHELSEAGCATVADLVRERDEARDKRAHETQHLLNCCAERDKALAASQAECARLREKLADVQETLEDSDMLPFTAASIGSVLASAPGSTDALREVCERAWRAGSLHGMGGCNPTDGPPWTEADDKRMAAEVANILGERGKEGGDA